MDRYRPVFVSYHLISRFSCSDPAPVGDLVFLISCPVKIFNCEILKGNVFAVVDIIEDLTCFFRIAGMYGGRTQIRDLTEYLAVRYLLGGTYGTALVVIDIDKIAGSEFSGEQDRLFRKCLRSSFDKKDSSSGFR